MIGPRRRGFCVESRNPATALAAVRGSLNCGLCAGPKKFEIILNRSRGSLKRGLVGCENCGFDRPENKPPPFSEKILSNRAIYIYQKSLESAVVQPSA